MDRKYRRAHLGILRIVNNPTNAPCPVGATAGRPSSATRQVTAALYGRVSSMAAPSSCSRLWPVAAIGGEIPPQVCAPLRKRLKTALGGGVVFTPLALGGKPPRAGGVHD